jgi:hypothetical protein
MPTTRTWFGGTGLFNNANDWNPTGVPVSGDTAVIDTGTVKLSNQGLSGVTINMNGTSEASQPVLALRNVALNGTIESTGGGSPDSSTFGEIDARGVLTSAGPINVLGGRAPEGHLTIDIHSGSSFVNTGTILDSDPTADSLVVNGGGTFVNNGTVQSQGGIPEFDTKIIGTGTFATGNSTLFGSGFTFGSSVSSGLTVLLSTTTFGASSDISIDKPLQFLAAVDNFGANPADTIGLPDTPFASLTSETFADNQLKLFDGHKLVADLNIIGDFTIANFSFSLNDAGVGTKIGFVKTPATAASDPPSIVPSMAHS